MPDSTSTGKRPRTSSGRAYEVPRLSRTRGPEPGTPVSEALLAIGTIVGTHGLGGELRVKLTTDDPDRFLDLETVLVGNQSSPRRIDSIRFHKGMALVSLEGIEDIDAAESLRGQVLRVSGADVPPLAADEYYLYQVVGLEARLEDGTVIGTVTDVIETGANMVFVVTPANGGKDELFPSIPDVVIDLNPAEGRLILRRQRFWDDDSAQP